MQDNFVEAVKKVQSGDKEAFAELFEEFKRPVYFQVSNIVRDKQDVDDIVSDVFTNAFMKIGDLRSPEAFPAWLGRIAVSKSTDYLRTLSKTFEDGAEAAADIESFEEIDPSLIPDKAFDNAETAELILEIIQTLPLPQRVCIHLYYYEGLSVKEIAENLAVSENTVKTRLSLARTKIREELEKREEKDGLKIWMASPLILIPILKFAAQGTLVPAGIAGKVLGGLGLTAQAAGAATAGTTAGASAAGVTTASATNTATAIEATAATATGATATTSATIGTGKIVAASVAAVAVTASVITGVVLLGGEEEEYIETEPVQYVSEYVEPSTEEYVEPTPEEEYIEPTLDNHVRLDYIGQGITDERLAELVATGEIPDNVSVTIFLNDNQISDISPLKGLTNLTGLFLQDNQISDISPLAGLTNLTSLFLQNNQISDISPLAGLTNLTDLSLNHNQISDISPLAGLTNLTDLRLASNQISDLSPLAELKNLTFLPLLYNQISDISPLAGLTNLVDLDLSGNQIIDLSPLAGLTNLTALWLYDTQISNEQIATLQAALPNCEILIE